jgi:hypothetical protein
MLVLFSPWRLLLGAGFIGTLSTVMFHMALLKPSVMKTWFVVGGLFGLLAVCMAVTAIIYIVRSWVAIFTGAWR